MRVGTTHEDALVRHRLQPAKRRRGGHRGRNAQAGNGYPKLRDLGLQQIEEPVSGRIREHIPPRRTGCEGGGHGYNALALELYVQLESVRAEVEAMRWPSKAFRNLASAGEWFEK
jgi:hypothetical protein